MDETFEESVVVVANPEGRFIDGAVCIIALLFRSYSKMKLHLRNIRGCSFSLISGVRYDRYVRDVY